MKWGTLLYYYSSLFTFINCLLSINALPAQQKPAGNYRNDYEFSERESYPGPEVDTGNISEDCLTSEVNSGINLSKETLQIANESKIKLAERSPKRLISLMEKLAITATPVTVKPQGRRLLIYPGTKWCGDGDIADGADDLGTNAEADKCCRIHDRCEDYIEGGDTKFNLTNKSYYTSLSCECDNEFNECLRRANTPTSNSIGALYFNIFARKCYGLDYPKKCKTHLTTLKLCSEYEPDTLAERIYQWIRPKKFIKL